MTPGWPASQPSLTDHRVRLRAWERRDADMVFRACQDPLVQRSIPIPVLYEEKDAVDFVFRLRRRPVGDSGRRAVRRRRRAQRRTFTESTTADDVTAQSAKNFRMSALGWVGDATWQGPVAMPIEQVDMSNQASWAASSEPGRVAKF